MAFLNIMDYFTQWELVLFLKVSFQRPIIFVQIKLIFNLVCLCTQIKIQINVSIIFVDTSFMYTMALLIMIKLYQNRHPDLNATAYATFSVLGIAVLLGG